eukprot:UN05418
MYYDGNVWKHNKSCSKGTEIPWTLNQEIEMKYTNNDHKITYTIDPIEIGGLEVEYIDKIKKTDFIPIISVWGKGTQVQVINVSQY